MTNDRLSVDLTAAAIVVSTYYRYDDVIWHIVTSAGVPGDHVVMTSRAKVIVWRQKVIVWRHKVILVGVEGGTRRG